MKIDSNICALLIIHSIRKELAEIRKLGVVYAVPANFEVKDITKDSVGMPLAMWSTIASTMVRAIQPRNAR